MEARTIGYHWDVGQHLVLTRPSIIYGDRRISASTENPIGVLKEPSPQIHQSGNSKANESYHVGEVSIAYY